MKKLNSRKELMKILEAFPEYQLPIVLSVMEALRKSLEEQENRRKEETFMAHLNSLPEEEEELSEECLKGMEEGRKAYREGRCQPWEEAAQELGI